MFIPIRDDQPTIRTPHLTIALIFINTAVFLYSKTQGVEGFERFLYMFGYTPGYLLDGDVRASAPFWYLLTPLYSMFLHGGWMHLIGNMLFLWIYGNNIEDYFGPTRFLLFYLVSGLAAVLLYTAFNPSSTVPLVGASGAVAGVMGAYMVLHPRANILFLIVFIFIMFREFPAKVVLAFWFGYQVLMSVMDSSTGGGVAYLAHVGGFVFGFLMLRLLIKFRRRGFVQDENQQVYRVHW